MTDQDITTHIKAEMKALEIEEAKLNHKYKHVYHFDMGTFNLLPDLERARKRREELEDALRVMGEFK